jgi:hypothetical protein
MAGVERTTSRGKSSFSFQPAFSNECCQTTKDQLEHKATLEKRIKAPMFRAN